MLMTLEELHQITGMQEEALINMRLMYKVMNTSDMVLEPQNRTNIQTMLEDQIGNMSINRQLDILAPMSGSDTGIGFLVIKGIKDISYRTRHLKKIEPELDKIWKNFTAATEGEILTDNEKITLKQYGMLHDLAFLNGTLEEYNKKGLIAGNEKLEKLYLQTQRAAKIVSHLDKTFDQNFTMPTGAVVFEDTKKKSQVYGKALGFFEQLIVFFVTKFGHASKGIVVESKVGIKENKVSHINPDYKQDKYSLRSYLYNDMHKIKIENLIDPDTRKYLQQHLGDKWIENVQQKFGDIERKIHDQNRRGHMHITADGTKGRFAQVATTSLQGGHKNFLMKDHANTDIRDDIFGKGKWEVEGRRGESRVLCSEFIGKTIIASVQELNDVLKKDLEARGVKDIPTRIVKSPISEKEKLYLLTPERLLRAMEERGAVERVQSPQELKKFMAIGNPSKTQNHKEKLQEAKSEDERSSDLQKPSDFSM